MLETVNKLSDCYVAVAALLGLQESNREIPATALGFGPERLSAAEVIARRVLRRMSLVDFEVSSTDRSARESFSSFELLPEEAKQIFKVGELLNTSASSQPTWLIKLFDFANSGWGVIEENLKDLLDSALLVPVLILVSNQLSSRSSSSAFEKLDDESLIQFLSRLSIISEHTGCWILTEKGRYLLDKAMIGAIAVSYAPLLAQLGKSIQTSGSPKESLLPTDANSDCEEDHVDRRLNVLSSGQQHKRFFTDLIRTAVDTFVAESTADIPKMVADMGCGDGSLLKQFHDSISSNPKIGRSPLLIAADLNRASLKVADQSLRGLEHIQIVADIREPQAFLAEIANEIQTGSYLSFLPNTEENPGELRDQILHIRTFLDHDRAYDEPEDIPQCEGWAGLSLTGQYLRRNGDLLPAHYAFQALVEHFKRWATVVGRHGLLLLEVHSRRPKCPVVEDHETNSIHFEAIHAWSGQQLIEADNFLLAAAAAGLFSDPRSMRRYPQRADFTQISLHWFHQKPFAIRMGLESDLAELMRLEKACWGELSIDADEILARLLARPSGVFLMTDRATGEIVGALSTQRISSVEVLQNSQAANLSELADPEGRFLQLLALNVTPERQEQGIGELLLQFVKAYANLSDQYDEIVGITRCRSANEESFEEYCRYVSLCNDSSRPIDPILRFHHEQGASIGEIIQGFRPNDHSNFGCGILIRYPIREWRDVTGNSHNSVKGIERVKIDDSNSADCVELEVESEIRQLLIGRSLTEFDANRPLVELGLDSLDIQELRLILSRRMGRELNSEFFFNYPTPSKIQSAITALMSDQETRQNKTTLAAMGMKDSVTDSSLHDSAAPKTETDRTLSIANTGQPKRGNKIPLLPLMPNSNSLGSSPEPIAIIGMACRFPGDVNTPDEFWNFLCSGRSGIIDVPKDRWNSKDYYDSNPDAPGKMWTTKGGFLRDIDTFDAAFFGISRREARMLDPQQRLLLETTWQALENAGIVPGSLSGSSSGVFVGIGGSDYLRYVMSDRDSINAYCATGTFQSTASGRLAYFYDLQGPCLSVDTACSSSIAALHLACQSLRSNESELAIVAGVNFISPEVSINFTKARMLSPDGICRTFDRGANGYVRGEGCGVVLIKRLSDAERDGDLIQAIIRGTGCNQDGHSNGLTAPNGLAQQRLLEKILAESGVSPDSITYAEAHGTATSLGDPIELNALLNALRRDQGSHQPLVIGSVKTNIGHLEAAAGMAGLIKVVQSLRHKQIPPHLNFSEWNPEIDRVGVNVTIPLALTAFPKTGPVRRATVSSFGFGGTNAMALIEEYNEPAQHQFNHSSACGSETEMESQVICLSARTEESLEGLTRDWIHFLPNSKLRLRDVAIASQICRHHFPVRRAVVGSNLDEIIEALVDQQSSESHSQKLARVPSTEYRLAFMFTGQGAQYPGMGNKLYDSNRVFRATMDKCFDLFAGNLPIALRDVMYASSDGKSALINETLYTQPALFSLEYALAQMWGHFGVSPDLCFGHSIGEITAAVTAGILTLEDAAAIVARRASLIDSLPRSGSMLACSADETTLSELLGQFEGELSIAACNSPNGTVVSGLSQKIQQIEQILGQRGIHSQRLMVSHAFHSPLLSEIAEAFREFCSQFEFRSPTIPVASNVTGQLFDQQTKMDADYLVGHLLGTVRFLDSIKSAAKLGVTLFMELGPGSTLCGLGKRSVPGRQYEWLNSLSVGKDGKETGLISNCLASLYRHGWSIDWANVADVKTRPNVRIPHYSFQRQTYWYRSTNPLVKTESPEIDKFRESNHPNGNGSGVKRGSDRSQKAASQDEELKLVVSPQGDVHISIVLKSSKSTDGFLEALTQHRIRQRSLFPAAGYLSLAIEGVLELESAWLPNHFPDSRHHRSEWQFSDAQVLKPFSLSTLQGQTVYLSLIRYRNNSPEGLSKDLDDRQIESIRWLVDCHYCREDAAPSRWVHCFTAELQRIPMGETESPIEDGFCDSWEQSLNGDEISGSEFYEALSRDGYQYGPVFQRVCRAKVQGESALSELRTTDRGASRIDRISSRIQLVDAIAHIALALRPSHEATHGASSLWLPVGWSRFSWGKNLLPTTAADAGESYSEETSEEVWLCNAVKSDSPNVDYESNLTARSARGETFCWRGIRFEKLKPESPNSLLTEGARSGQESGLAIGIAADEDSRQSYMARLTTNSDQNAEQVEDLLCVLSERLAGILMLEEGETVSPDTLFSELGMDSIMATEFELEVEKLSKDKIPSEEFVKYQSLRQLALRLRSPPIKQ
jgi:acyl transferase domain-containing protein/ribosomal protein S18 acetylase RimI-like enzyme